jgi:hypothetical protein
MRIRRSLPIFTGVLLFAAAVTVIVQLRKHAPPEPARLLPGADGFFYVNLKWIRRANMTAQLPAVLHDPEYEQFIQSTGFLFERDLDQAAFAVHYPASTPKSASEPRFSEVFSGKIDGERLRAYLQRVSASTEDYHSVNIYSIPLEGRTLRVAMLAVGTVAASNHNDPQVIRGIIDRSRKLASPFGGPALLRRYYKYVPIASLGWAVFDAARAGNAFQSAKTLSFSFSKPAVVVASLRYLGRVHFRAEAFTGSADEAHKLAEQVSTFLNIFHTAENTVAAQGTDPDVKSFFDGLKVSQNDDRAVLTATLPPGFVRKAFTETPNAVPAPPTSTITPERAPQR